MAVTFGAPAPSLITDLSAVGYRVLIGEHRQRRILAEVPAAQLTYTDELNAPGSVAFTLPVDDPIVTPDLIWPGRRNVFIERAGAVVWGGWIKTCRADASTLNVAGEGWWSYFRRRWRLGPWKYAQWDLIDIARHIVALLEEDAIALPDVDPSPASTGVLRDFEWIGHDKTAGAALEELCASAPGLEWSIDFPDWPSSWPVPVLHFHYPTRGRRIATRIDEALPIASFEVEVDGIDVAESISVFGRDNPDYPEEPWTGRWAIERSQAWENGYPAYQLVEAQRDIESLDLLTDIARKRMVNASDCLVVPNVTFATAGVATSAATTLAPGDTVFVHLHQGWAQVSGWYRIMSKSIAVEADGTERTSLTFSPAALAGT